MMMSSAGSLWQYRSRNVFYALLTVSALLVSPVTAFAQAGEEAEDEDDTEEAGSGTAPASPPAATTSPAPPAAPPAPPPPPPSPFTLVVKGLISGSLFVQNAPAPGTGGAFGFGPNRVAEDGWFLGGDVRQSRLTFTIRGPEVLGGATPIGVMEMDLNGYNYQVTPVGGLSVVLGAGGTATGNAVTQALPYNVLTNEPRLDENLVAHVRLAYTELNWGASQNVLRVGQYHNLLLGMIAGSASHLGVPIGYGAGQLGWRSPGITYIHRFALSPGTNVDVGLQVNRNSWRDELPTCPTAAATSAAATQPTQPPNGTGRCLPFGISAGEASMLPQVEARVMAFGGVAESPLPFYLPTKWLAYVAGHWDQKDVTGVGGGVAPAMAAGAPPGAVSRDSMTTYVAQFGGKIQLGPVLVAANGWYGQNAGNVFGHIFQMQDLNRPDVSGFGAWGQLGIGLGKNLSVWGFAGIDKPDEAQAIAAAGPNYQGYNGFNVAGITRLQNVQLAGQLAYTDGPIQIAAELLYVATKNLIQSTLGSPAVPGNPTATPPVPDRPAVAPTAALNETLTAVQPSITVNYSF